MVRVSDRLSKSSASAARHSWKTGFLLAGVVALVVVVFVSEESVLSADSLLSVSQLQQQEEQHEFLTVGEIKQFMRLPCNYVHDGLYLQESNNVLNQVYQTIIKDLDDDIIPLVIESGGHDGITKSLSLKASICLNVNTMLIEASPTNYNILKHTRKYDRTVNAALCEQDYVEMEENEMNSGQSHVVQQQPQSAHDTTTLLTKEVVRVSCTSIDSELDKIRDTLPAHQQSKLQLVFLILDIEGFEPTAARGLQRYSPHQAMIEWKHLRPDQRDELTAWASKHGLVGHDCGQDRCFNFHANELSEANDSMREVFYGARKRHPQNTPKTSTASKAYYFYGT